MRFSIIISLALSPFLCSAIPTGIWDSDFFNSVKSQFDTFVKQVDVETYTDYYSGGHRYVQVVKSRSDGSILKYDMIGDRAKIEEILGVHHKMKAHMKKTANMDIEVTKNTKSEMNKVIDSCMAQKGDDRAIVFKDFLNKINPLNLFKQITRRFTIFPGTKWCGDGDVAKNYDDLGMARETDKCCRDHDHAPENMAAGGSNYGLKNPLAFSITRCKYDLQLYTCLANASTVASNAVGVMYFNLLRTKCFELSKPATCAKQSFPGICEKYQYEEKESEKWQILLPKMYRIAFQSNDETVRMNEALGIAEELQKLSNIGEEWKEAITASLGGLADKFATFHEKFMDGLKDLADIFMNGWRNGNWNIFHL